MAGLLDEFTDGVSETLSAGWDSISNFAGGLLQVSPERQAEVDKYYADLETARRNDIYGRHDWRFKEPSTDPNKVKRFIERIPTGVAGLMDESQAVFSTPQHMIKGAIDLGTGGVLNAFGAETIGEEQRAVADAFGGQIKDLFKDLDSFTNGVANNPVETMSILLGGGVGAVKLAQLAKNPAVAPALRNTLVSLIGEDPMDSIMSGVLKSNLNPGLAKLGESKIPVITYQGTNTGARYTKLDMDKVGSNSGTKVQGHGLYVAENKDTGKRFARHDNEMMTNAKLMAEMKSNTPIETRIWDDLSYGVYPDTIRKEIMKDLKGNPEGMAQANKILSDVELEFDTALNQLYEIDLSDEAVSSMIRRELPLTGQPDIVQDLMRKNNMSDTSTGKDFYESLTEQFADEVGGFGAERAASAYLNDNGVPGMKFLDELGNSAAKYAGKPDPRASNYVLYNSDITKVLKRQDIDITKNTGDRITIGSTLGETIDDRFATRKSDKDKINQGLMDVQIETMDNSLIYTPELDIRDLEGYPIVGTMVDNTAGGDIMTSVNGHSIIGVDGKGVKREAGSDYPFIEENVDRGYLWASATDAVNKIVKQAGEARQLYKKDPLLMPFSMSPTGMDFSQQLTKTMLNSAINGLDAKQLKVLDNLIKTTSKESVKNAKGQFYIRQINKEWKGSKSDNPLEGTTGSERKEIARIIDVNFRDTSGKLVKGDANGVLSYPTARLANADPRQLNKKQGTLQTVGVMDMQNSVAGKRSHSSYDETLMGGGVGVLTPKQRELSILDLVDNTKADGSPMTAANMTDADMRKLTMQSPPIGLLTHERLMNLEKKGLLD